MSEAKRERYQKMFASNIFNIPSVKCYEKSLSERQAPESTRRKSNQKNIDHFSQLQKPPSKAQLKTGKKLNPKRSTDVLNQKKKPINILRAVQTNRKNVSQLSLGNADKAYRIKKEVYESDYEPDKYLKTESAHSRKMKEIYNVAKPTTKCLRYSRKEEDEKKIKVQIRQKIHRDPLQKPDNNRSFSNVPRVNKLILLQSNIFNSASKEALNKRSISESSRRSSSNHSARSASSNQGQRTNYFKKLSDLSGYFSGLDWKNAKTELLFNKKRLNYSSEPASTSFSKNVLKTGSDCSRDSSTDKIKIIKKNKNTFKSSYIARKALNNKNNCTNSKTRLKTFYNNYSTSESKAKKLAENYSSLQGEKFLEENFLKKLKNERKEALNKSEVKYEVKDVEPYQEKEITRTFNENGIQLFDLNHSSNPLQQGNTQSIQFKIRQNYNDMNYQKKLTSVIAGLKKKTGKDVKLVKPRTNFYKQNFKSLDFSNSTSYTGRFKKVPRVNTSSKEGSSVGRQFTKKNTFSTQFSNIDHTYKSNIFNKY